MQYKENRLRTTLLHELGHVVIHDPLWQREFKKLQLPFDTKERRIQICKRKALFSKMSLIMKIMIGWNGRPTILQVLFNAQRRNL